MLSAIDKKRKIRCIKIDISGSSIFFIGTLLFIIVYDAITGESSQSTVEYCASMAF
jgi:hypothetical protein